MIPQFFEKNVGLDLENLSQLYLDTLSLALTTEPGETTKCLPSSAPTSYPPYLPGAAARDRSPN